MNIVLIGMRGSGKTTLAQLLAKKLKKKYIETDELIVNRMGMSIPEIIANHDWEYFRNIESEVVRDAAKEDNCVISTGGGVVLRPENIKFLKKNGKIFLLQASINTLLERIGDDPNRPSLTGKISRREDMEETLKQRQQLYQEAAQVIISTEHSNPKEIVKKILIHLEKTYIN